MDPFSLAVGISGLVALSASVLKLIEQHFHGIKHADEAASELRLLHRVLCRLDGFLRSDSAKKHSFDDTSILLSSTRACIIKLEVLYKKLDAAGKSRLLRASWPLNEKEHRQSVQELRAVTQCIHFAMSIDECVLLSKTSEEVTEILRGHLETFQILSEISHSTTSLEASVREQTRILRRNHMTQEREKILDWISTFDQESKHNAIRMPRVAQTGEWLIETKEFKAWRMGAESPRVLWCHGIQGAGKSIMTSLVIDRLRDDHVGQKVALAFVYFDYRDQGNQSPENVVANLLRQVASQNPVLPISLVELYTKFKGQDRKPQIEDFELTLLGICQYFDQVFILIDALDECEEAMRRKNFIPFLAALQQTPGIHLFITSRPYPEDIRKALDPVPQISVQASDADLTKYLRRQIENSGNADIIDQDFRQRLIETITKRAQKMFLLPALQIQSIVNEPTTGAMEDAIEAMPRDLSQAFYQTIARIQRQPDGRKQLGMNVLLWLSHARGSLTVAELSEAMAVKPGSPSLNPRRRPSPGMMIECCMGLVTVDRESIHLVHYALQEFFRDQREEIFPSGEDHITDICIGYLFFDELRHGYCEAEADITRLMKAFPLLRYASCYWGHHVRSSQCDRSYELALELLQSPPRRALSIQIRYFSQGYRDEYWEPDEVTSHDPFYHACSFGLERIVCDMLESEDIDIDAATHNGTTALILATSSGHVGMVELLLSRGADPEKANWYGSALHCSAEAGQCQSIKLLLDSGMNVDLKDEFGRTALHCATDQRHISAIELLLDMGANPNEQDHVGTFLIHEAARTADQRLMRRLLRDERVDVSATTDIGETALHCAATCGDIQIVRMLLDAGVEIEAKNDENYTALHLAALRGREGVVRLLVEAGAEVNAKSGNIYILWYLAATASHGSFQKLLLEYGAEEGSLEHLVSGSQSAGEDG